LRVRILSGDGRGETAVVTFKGPRHGYCRLEFEYPLAVESARQALKSLPSNRIIRKTRYSIHGPDSLAWSLDHFGGANSGLVIAEIELADPDQPVELPPWVGDEVTSDPRYGNSRLAVSPIPSLARAA
jgi:CYTH domain-containing protein